MSLDEWGGARRLFAQWPNVQPDATNQGTLRRLGDALAGLSRGEAAWRDIASLTRQLLLRSEAMGTRTRLPVPLAPGLPTMEQWQEAWCSGISDGTGASLWADAWAPASQGSPVWDAAWDQVLEAVLGDEAKHRRNLEGAPADPFWREVLGYTHYRSHGQQQAARSVALAPAGSTTIVCLPTGHGKTPVALASAMLAGRPGGVSVLVVPTVVLALDMERRVRAILRAHDPVAAHQRLAYTSELDDAAKKQIREAVAAGRQRIVIAAPEAVTTGLQKALDDAASAGLLRHLIIDEAHLVEQWGNEFRSAFQTLAVQRRSWLRRAPSAYAPRTIAMSATLTQQQVETLETLFSEEGSVDMLWASELRSEPAYFLDSYSSETERQQEILRAATLLPKPMVLYTTTVEDAKKWAHFLRDQGMHRVTAVHGDSSAPARRQSLAGWSGQDETGRIPTRYDIVVGTSAFGLGVDLSDVRTVLHACIPETVDRFYQEVGRGGRDGHPCLSYLVTAPGDLPTAQSVNQQKIITEDTAWERWEAMFRQRLASPVSSLYRVSLETRPARLPEGYRTHQDWNQRILNLMSRMGMIELFPPAPPERSDDDDECTWDRRLQEFFAAAPSLTDIHLNDFRVNNPQYYRSQVREFRRRITRAQGDALQRMHRVLEQRKCVADELAKYYQVTNRGRGFLTIPACRGCPHCRADGFPAKGPGALYRAPLEIFPLVTEWPLRDRPLDRLHPHSSCLSVYWRSAAEREDNLLPFLARLARSGVAYFGGPGLDAAMAANLQRQAPDRPIIVDHDATLIRDVGGTVVWVTEPVTQHLDDDATLRYRSNEPLYLLHPVGLRLPDRPDKRLADLHPGSLALTLARKEF